jgi:hypothetical protein
MKDEPQKTENKTTKAIDQESKFDAKKAELAAIKPKPTDEAVKLIARIENDLAKCAGTTITREDWTLLREYLNI